MIFRTIKSLACSLQEVTALMVTLASLPSVKVALTDGKPCPNKFPAAQPSAIKKAGDKLKADK